MIKTVVKASYVHKSNIQELIDKKIPTDKKEEFIKFMELIKSNNIPFDVVKYDQGNVTLITSPDWDTSNEPIVGECRRWKDGEWFNGENLNNNFKLTKNFRQIYHNKWQFVDESYQGFNVEEAKERTKIWNAIPNLNKSKIGNKVYWVELLTNHNIAV